MVRHEKTKGQGLILNYPAGPTDVETEENRKRAEGYLEAILEGKGVVLPDTWRLRMWNGKELRNVRAVTADAV